MATTPADISSKDAEIHKKAVERGHIKSALFCLSSRQDPDCPVCPMNCSIVQRLACKQLQKTVETFLKGRHAL